MFDVRGVSCLLGPLLLTPVSAACGQSAPPTLAITGVDVISMTEPGVLRDRTVLIAGDRILRVGPADDVEVPEGVRRLDGAGRILIPGLVDAHVHLLDANDLPLLLAHGVTTVLDMSGSEHQLAMRDAVERGELAGPRIFTTGPQLKVEVNPVVDFERSATSPEEARRRVAHAAERGYDFVKVWGPLASDVYAATLSAAADHDIRVTGHIPRDVGLEGVLAAGQSSIAHVEEYFNKVFGRRIDDSRLPEVVAATAASGVTVITTLGTYDAIAASIADDIQPLLDRPDRRLLDPVRRLLWEPGFNRHRTPGRRGEEQEYLDALAFQMVIAAELHDAGVPLLAGSDAGELPGLVPGSALHAELGFLVAAGLSEWEALATATVNPGRYLTGDPLAGTVAEGAPADLVLLEGDPLESIDATRRIVTTIARGVAHDPAELLARVEAANAATGPFVELVLAGDLDSAHEELRTRLSADDRPPALMPMLFLAYILAEGGDMPSAVRVLAMAAEAHPESYLPDYMLGMAALAAGDEAAGRAALERVLERVPGHDGALEALGRDTR